MNPSASRVSPAPLIVPIAGRALNGWIWRAVSARGLVLIVHGLGEHAGRYGAFASDLVEAGFTVAAVDWPGHGRSPGTRGDAQWLEVRDAVIPAAWDVLDGEAAGRPRVLFGHSMGGLMALDYALAHPERLTAVVASAPALRASGAPPRWKLALGHVLRVVAPAAGIPHGLPIDELSRDAEVIRLYRTDPLVGSHISARLYFGLLDAQTRVFERAPSLATPALVLTGTADHVVDSEGAGDFVAAARPAHVQFVAIDGAYHQILDDPGRDATIGRIVDWLSESRRV
jgi:lysophospholipase